MWLRSTEFTDEHSAYFATLGRAIALAQNFEQNLKFVFGTVDLGIAFEQGKLEDGGKWREYGKKLMARPLRTALREQREEQPISNEDFSALEAARQARNYLAHEAAQAGLYIPPRGGKLRGAAGLKKFLDGSLDPAAVERERSDMLMENFRSALPRLIQAVTAIALGDNIISGLSYMIQEKESPPTSSANRYAEITVAWVLEPVRMAGIAKAGDENPIR